jgi:teichuronic acid biosynthesis protein TuaE
MVSIHQKKYLNIYDYLIIALLTLLGFGIIGGAYSPIRIAVLLLVPAILFGVRKIALSRILKYATAFLFFFFLYALISFFWTLDQTQGAKELIYYLLYIILSFEMVFFSRKAKWPLNSICMGWIGAVLITLPTAFQELIFDKHLSLSLLDSDTMINIGEGIVRQKIFASATFGNYNGYVTFLAFALPFLYAYSLSRKSINSLFLSFSVVIIVSGIILVNASRGGVLSSFMLAAIAFIFTYKKSMVYHRSLIFFIYISIAVSLFLYFSIIGAQLMTKLNVVSMIGDESRSSLASSSLQILSSSDFMGTGVGSLVVAFMNFGNIDIYIPHNFFIELLVQYGVIVAGFFLVILVQLFVAGWISNNEIVRFTVMSGLATLPIVGVINSGYWLSPIYWAFFASLFAMVDYREHHSRHDSRPSM